jgi:hypothetical protein
MGLPRRAARNAATRRCTELDGQLGLADVGDNDSVHVSGQARHVVCIDRCHDGAALEVAGTFA